LLSAIGSDAITYVDCDDDKNLPFWVEALQQAQKCVWLAARPEYQATLCQPTDPSGAYSICEETCGKCHDNCEDTSGTFAVNDDVRDCLWLSLRTQYQGDLCVQGSPAFSICPETCDACDGQGILGSAPTVSPSFGGLRCDDSKFDMFFVGEIDENQRCVWLAARPEWQTILCVGGHPSKAREVCPETCGACVDNCVDSESQFNVEGKRRDCLWLSLRPQLHPELCEREDVGRACPETCDKCDIAI
jgi:hypothetical protein